MLPIAHEIVVGSTSLEIKKQSTHYAHRALLKNSIIPQSRIKQATHIHKTQSTAQFLCEN